MDGAEATRLVEITDDAVISGWKGGGGGGPGSRQPRDPIKGEKSSGGTWVIAGSGAERTLGLTQGKIPLEIRPLHCAP